MNYAPIIHDRKYEKAKPYPDKAFKKSIHYVSRTGPTLIAKEYRTLKYFLSYPALLKSTALERLHGTTTVQWYQVSLMTSIRSPPSVREVIVCNEVMTIIDGL